MNVIILVNVLMIISMFVEMNVMMTSQPVLQRWTKFLIKRPNSPGWGWINFRIVCRQIMDLGSQRENVMEFWNVLGESMVLTPSQSSPPPSAASRRFATVASCPTPAHTPRWPPGLTTRSSPASLSGLCSVPVPLVQWLEASWPSLSSCPSLDGPTETGAGERRLLFNSSDQDRFIMNVGYEEDTPEDISGGGGGWPVTLSPSAIMSPDRTNLETRKYPAFKTRVQNQF